MKFTDRDFAQSEKSCLLFGSRWSPRRSTSRGPPFTTIVRAGVSDCENFYFNSSAPFPPKARGVWEGRRPFHLKLHCLPKENGKSQSEMFDHWSGFGHGRFKCAFPPPSSARVVSISALPVGQVQSYRGAEGRSVSESTGMKKRVPSRSLSFAVERRGHIRAAVIRQFHHQFGKPAQLWSAPSYQVLFP